MTCFKLINILKLKILLNNCSSLQVINGLFERTDWQTAIKELPVGIIPCGSGNGLAKTIAYALE